MATKKTKTKKKTAPKKAVKKTKKRTANSKVRSSVKKKKAAQKPVKKSVKKAAKRTKKTAAKKAAKKPAKKTTSKKTAKKSTKKTAKKTAAKKTVKKKTSPAKKTAVKKATLKKSITAPKKPAEANEEKFLSTSYIAANFIANAKTPDKPVAINVGGAAKSPYVVDIYFEDEKAPRLETIKQEPPVAYLGVDETYRSMSSRQNDLRVVDHELDLDEIMDDFKRERRSIVSEISIYGLAEIAGIALCKIQSSLIWPFSFLKPTASNFRDTFIDTPLERLTTPITISPPQGWTRALVSLAGLALIFIIPFQGWTYYKELKENSVEIERHGIEAVEHLKSVEGGKDLTAALFALGRANQSFKLAEQEMADVNKLVIDIASIMPKTGKKVQSAEALIGLGDNLTAAATLLAKGAQSLLESDEANLATKLKLMISYVEQARPLIIEAEAMAGQVDVDSLPPDYRDSFSLVFENLEFIKNSLDNFIELGKTMELFLGSERKQRYLVIFENNTEIRPSGGFMGSFALMDIDRGEITNIEVPGGGTYDMQGSLDTDVVAPEPLRLIADRWEFQDSNWFADFPASAKKMIWFYEHSGGPTPDGVIVITATVMEELLKIYGPIPMPDYGRDFTADNFIEETQKIVELEYDKEENKPKKVIGDLAPIMLEKILNADRDKFVKTISVFGRMIREKQVIIFHRNDKIQEVLSRQNWTGEVADADQDYLMIVNANIAGGKTDGVIDQAVELTTEISDQGKIINYLTITRTHNGVKNQGFSGVNNVNYMRVYVPRGSELINASGFNPPEQELFDQPREGSIVDDDLAEIEGTWSFHHSGAKVNNEFGKTVFGGWTQTMPGEATRITFKYRLPFRLQTSADKNFIATVKEKLGFPTTQTYSLLWQKQPGAKEIEFTHLLKYPKRYSAIWSNIPEILRGEWSALMRGDAFSAVLFEKSF